MLFELMQIGDHVVVRQHDAFGNAGRAARIGKSNDVSRELISVSGTTPSLSATN